MGPFAPMLRPVASPPPPPAWSWTGVYIGANGGGGWSHTNVTATQTTSDGTAEAFGGSFSGGSGGLAGGQIGVNYQLKPWPVVIGLEADADWSNIFSGTLNSCGTFTSPAILAGLPSACASANGTLNDFGTIRVRGGYAVDNWLIYGTAGAAWEPPHDAV